MFISNLSLNTWWPFLSYLRLVAASLVSRNYFLRTSENAQEHLNWIYDTIKAIVPTEDCEDPRFLFHSTFQFQHCISTAISSCDRFSLYDQLRCPKIVTFIISKTESATETSFNPPHLRLPTSVALTTINVHLPERTTIHESTCSGGLPAMSLFARSRLAPPGETIDLTSTASASSSNISPSGNPPQLIDLTTPGPVSDSPRDHMHAVVALLRPAAIDLTQDTSDGSRKRRVARIPNSHLPPSQISSIKDEQTSDLIDTSSLQSSHPRMEEPITSSDPLAWNTVHQSETSGFDQQHAQKSGKKPLQPFPFLDFPPEIRNCVYKMLLTTPKIPIEFPEPTGRNRALRVAKWEKCTTWKMKRRHKTIFLEILEVSKQLHAEASGILYGCNTFKYRSDYGTYTQ